MPTRSFLETFILDMLFLSAVLAMGSNRMTTGFIVAGSIPVATSQPLESLPTWAWWSLGGITLSLLVTFVIWCYVSFYRRVVFGALGAIGVIGALPAGMAWFNVPGFGEGGFWIEQAPSAAWPLAAIAIAALLCEWRRQQCTRLRSAPDKGKPTVSATAFIGGRSAASSTGHSVSGDQAMLIGRDAYHGAVTVYQADPQLVERLIQQSQENGKLKLAIEHLTAAKKRLEEELGAALERTQAKATAGDTDARQAMERAIVDGDFVKVQEVLVNERDRLKDRGDLHPADWLKLNREVAAVSLLRGDTDAAADALRRILAVANDDIDATADLGQVYLLRGDLEAAEQQYRRLLIIAPQDARAKAIAFGNLGIVSQSRGNVDGAERLYRESLELCRQIGDLEGQAKQLNNLAGLAWKRNDLAAAEALVHEALELNRKLGHLGGQAAQLGNLGLIAKDRGDLDTGERLIRDALEIEKRLGRLYGQARQLGNLGLIALERGDLDTAERHYREALDLNRKLGRLGPQAKSIVQLGIINKRRGHIAEARRLWNECRDLFAKAGMIGEMLDVEKWLCELCPPESRRS